MKYWKTTSLLNPYTKSEYDISNTYTEITKQEYDLHVTIPNMSKNNILHNYANGAEAGLRSAKLLYLEELKQLVNLNGHSVLDVTQENLQKFNDFKNYMEVSINADLARFVTMYDSKLAGDDDNVAVNKATVKVIPDDNLSALAGRDAFLKWAVVKLPQLRKYIEYTNSLNYSTFATEDEPEGGE